MIRRISLVALSLLIAVPLAAQAPAGLQLRLDHSTNAEDPDDVPDVAVTPSGDGFQVRTGPAVTAWNSRDSATGSYTLKGIFTLLEPSSHVNYYGLVYGGGDLEGSGQNYLYFLVAQDGSYLVKHRAGNETTHDIVGRTPHSAGRGGGRQRALRQRPRGTRGSGCYRLRGERRCSAYGRENRDGRAHRRDLGRTGQSRPSWDLGRGAGCYGVGRFSNAVQPPKGVLKA